MSPQQKIVFTEQAIVERLEEGFQKAIRESAKLPSEPFEPISMNIVATTFATFFTEVAKEMARLHSALSATDCRHEDR